MRGGNQVWVYLITGMKTIDLVYETLLALEKEHVQVTTGILSEKLDLKRNLVSHYLNQLIDVGKLKKGGTKPVYYFTNNQMEEITQIDKEVVSPFYQLIGYDGSLKAVIENCKAVVNYPVNGLPILITGSTGVGKSFLAEIVYQYALTQKVIGTDAPFIKLNCADYADNKELLSTMLFGHTKNAFTGAVSETEGLINQADGGFFFLDEVHRLSNEGQEKLFQVLDNGEYRKIGDSSTNQNVRVRFIFATSEDPEKVLIRTLRRRIPIITRIPDLKDRPIIEKYELITSFYQNESRIFQKPIQIDPHVMNYLLSYSFMGNIGEVANLVKSSCAQTFNSNCDSSMLHIDMKALKLNLYDSSARYVEYMKHMLTIDLNKKEHKLVQLEKSYTDIFYHFFESMKAHIEQLPVLKKCFYTLYDKSNSKDYEDTSNYLLKDMIEIIIENIKNTYGINFGMNASIIMFHLIHFYNIDEYPNMNEIQSVWNQLQKRHAKLCSISEMILNKIEANCGIKINLAARLLIDTYMITLHMSEEIPYNALIIAHGNSTATSVACVVNRMLETYVFEACDIPFDTSYETFLKITNEYLKRIDCSKSTIILADMGSVANIYQRIAGTLDNELLMVNNISTGLALEIGNRMKQKQELNMIVECIRDSCLIEYKYVSNKKKKKAILVVCVSGIGAAEVIKDILCEFVDENHMLITCDYMSLISEGKKHTLFQNYDVSCIVSTNDISELDVSCINISKVVVNESRDQLLFIDNVLGNHHKDNLDEAKTKIVKTFTLENLVNRLVFLKPEIVIEDVEKIVFDIEVSLGSMFESNMKMMLYIHLAVLLERAILKNCDEDCYKDEQWMRVHHQQLQHIKESFHGVEQKYHVEISLAEIVNVLDIIMVLKN